MQRKTTIAVWCERIIEGGWLLAVMLIPNYFNLLSSRHFEPDKATTLRGIVLIMAAAALIRMLEMWGGRPSYGEAPAADSAGAVGAWRRLTMFPLALPTLVYVLVFLLATVTSVVPSTSFWGSYQRLQGTYTNLSYVLLATLMALLLRQREQFDRLIVVMILASLVVIGYGLAQHEQLDPLPWKGDVITRVASTMGNSIFAAAYLILVVPYALYRALASLFQARQLPADSGGAGADLGWALSYLLLVLGSLALIFSSIKFGAYVRTADLRYWWVYPGALIAALGLFIVPSLRPHIQERLRMSVWWPGILALLYILLVVFSYTVGQGSGQRGEEYPGRIAHDWGQWMGGGTLMIVVAYLLIYFLPRRPAASTRLLLRLQSLGLLLIFALGMITIFLTQSRGPWIGGGVGLFVFFTLLLLQLFRRARAAGSSRARLWLSTLIAEIVLSVVVGGFLIAFNLSDAQVFQQLRDVPYIGRMGRLLETESGTGLVRRLIWLGDDKAGGAVALILSDPVRTVIGWGPESMFVAYNKFYPPSLANIEARGASPDRSHEAYLDELVTKGLLGLISYFFVLFSFFALAWRLMRRMNEWPLQIFYIACVSVVIAHGTEGLSGIPIVSTLLLFWITLALLVLAGAIDGQYSLDWAKPPAAEPEASSAELAAAAAPAGKGAGKGTQAQSGKRARQGAAARGASQGRAVAGRRSRRSSTNTPALLVYALIMVLTLMGVWFLNADNVYADMRFQQSQNYTEASGATLDQQIIGVNYLLDALRMESEQDFYYLSLGRSLMNITDLRRQQSNTPAGEPKADASVADLLRLQDALAVQTFVNQRSPLELLSYARAVLERAREINPLNKDHYANLARMYSFWYSRFDRSPEILQTAIDWYRQGHEIAPQDVVIMNEYAGTVALLASEQQTRGDQSGSQASYAQAEQLLNQSKELDPRYSDTDARLAELLRLEGRTSEATDRYAALLEQNPHALDSQISSIIDGMIGQPDQLKRLRDVYVAAAAKSPKDATLYTYIGAISIQLKDLPGAADAYAHLTELQPTNIDAARNYTLVLSDTMQYTQAISEAEKLLTLSQQDPQGQQQVSSIQALIQYLKARAGVN